ncbi:MAG: hypothetical protein ACXWDU_02395 [Actinomycetota bacterium]
MEVDTFVMDAIVVAEPTGWFRPRSGSVTIATVSVLSIAAFLGMRVGAYPPRQFEGACERLREAGLAIVPQDVFCRPMPWTTRAAYVVASLLVAVGFVLPGVISAASGRRLTAFVPLLGALAVRYPQDVFFPTRLWGSTTWPRGPVASMAVTMVVMALPVGAVVYAKRRSRIIHGRPSLIAGVAATVLCCGGVAGTVFVARDLLTRHIGGFGFQVDIAGIVPEAIAIAVFGALIGPDRRWWPWSLVPVAILLSGGPSDALIIGPEHVLNWYQFGVVLPLFAAGLVGSAWGPLAAGLARLFPDEEEAWEAPSEPLREPSRMSPGRIRPVVVLNAFAAGLLAVSLIVFRADPLPVQTAMALPTYLGARISVQDLRTRLDLRRAMRAMDAYRAATGTYRGFNAARGVVADPSLVWNDGLPVAGSGSEYGGPVGIVSAGRREARVAAFSASGTAFCLQRADAGLTYGAGPRTGAGDGPEAVLDRAIAACGSTPWSAEAVRRFPISTMCVGVEPDSYLICRVVQALMTKTMQGS